MNRTVLLIITLLCITVCYGSSGDRQPQYIHCVDQCSKEDVFFPIYLKLFKWTIRDNCGYHCMHSITENAIRNNQRIHQYHGKWPFYRLYGIQEPASVLFSILNGLMHLTYFKAMTVHISDEYYLKKFYLGASIVGMNAWLWSTVFHTRDTPWTEKLDYYSAGLYILYSLYTAMIRIFYLRGKITLWVWTVFCSSLYVMHVGYLSSLTRFDYGYNMTACIVIGSLQTSAWLVWSVLQYTGLGKVERRPFAWMAGVSVVLVSCAMCLEVFDFPPYKNVLDAHSLWHAATIPLTPLFYKFLIHDSKVETAALRKQKKEL